MKNKVAVVILNWNGKFFLEKFLPKVISCSQNTQIIVADNCSTDDSIEFVSTQYPNIQIIKNPSNNGFAKGYNQALKQIEAEYYILLNSDVEVTENWISPIIQLMEKDKDIAACQPKILDYNSPHQFEYAGACGGFIDKYAYPFCRGRIFNVIEEDKHQYDEITEVFWATGACMFVKAEAFWQVNGFDDDYFAHMEEIDLCWRLKRKGLKLFCIPQSQVFHVGGGTLHKSNPRKTYLNFRNNLMMLYKNLPPQKMLPVLISRIMLDKLAGISFFFSGNVKDTIAVYKAYFYILKNYKRLRKQRNNSGIPFREVSNIYKRSLVSAYYLKKQHQFSELDPTQFTQ